MNKTFKFRLMPTSEQATQMRLFADARRFVWNWMLDANKQAYEHGGIFIWRDGMIRGLPDLKEQNPWLKSAHSFVLCSVCADLDKALPNKRRQFKGFPRFKSGKRDNQTFTISQIRDHIKVQDRQILIPKIGLVRCRISRPIEGKIKLITCTERNGVWSVSVVVELPDVPLRPAIDTNIVGIDMGMRTFAALSDGTEIRKPNHVSDKERGLKRYQRRVSRKQKGSKNREKSRIRLARAHERVTNDRNDWLHKESRKIVDTYDGICTEDLRTKDLMKGNKKLGRRAVNRKIADLAWGRFLSMLEYKAAFSGNLFVRIDRWAPSSQVCSCCDHRVGPMSTDIREWTCPSCGTWHDRDFNAALNIRRWGIQRMPSHLVYVPQELREFTPVEITSSTSDRGQVQLGSLKQEAPSFMAE